MIKRIFLILTVILIASLVFASDYFVDVNSGTNENSGTSEGNAWKTISYAISQVVGSENNPTIIHIASGEYTLSSGESFPIEMKDFITLLGSDQNEVVIDAGNSATVFKCGKDGDITGPSGVYFQNLTIQNGAAGSCEVRWWCLLLSIFSGFYEL